MVKADKSYGIDSKDDNLCVLSFVTLELSDFSDEDVFSLFAMIGKPKTVEVDFLEVKGINVLGFFFINRFLELCRSGSIFVKIKNSRTLASVFMQTGIDKKYFISDL